MNSTVTVENRDKETVLMESSEDAHTNDAFNAVPNAPSVSSDVSTLLNEDELDTNLLDDTQSRTSSFSHVIQPLFKVIFRDETVARRYRERIKEYLYKLMLSKPQPNISDESSSLSLEIWDDETNSQSQDIGTESKESEDSDYTDLFTVDTRPMLKDDLDIPTYGKKYEKVYEKPGMNPMEKAKEESCLPRLSSLNSTEKHSPRDCTQSRNQFHNNRNRKGFNAKSNAKAVRYHLEDDQRFGHMVPGRLSGNLRKALGLEDNQLPKHIYRMRTLGYPPGWLEEARVQHSGLTLFNSDGVAERDPNEEPGEIIVDASDKDQYDITKIYDFPGFNVPPPPGTRDEYMQHGAPQMQFVHSKEMMLSVLRCRKVEEGYQRKKLKLSAGSSTPPDSQTTPCEMNIEDVSETIVENVPVNGHFLLPLPKHTPVKPPEPASPIQTATEDSDEQSQKPLSSPTSPHEQSATHSYISDSPSLADLESIKKQLLVALEDSSSQSNPGTPTRADVSGQVTPTSTPGNLMTPETSHSQSLANTSGTSHGSVKSIDLGTPLLQSTSPYSKLPSSEKFSKNICDVINYENLPDSTGKYEQMTGIIQKVRDTLAKINQQSE